MHKVAKRNFLFSSSPKESTNSPVISPFVDFPAIQAQFITDMKARGMKVAKTTDF